jgi:hypothetical protein
METGDETLNVKEGEGCETTAPCEALEVLRLSRVIPSSKFDRVVKTLLAQKDTEVRLVDCIQGEEQTEADTTKGGCKDVIVRHPVHTKGFWCFWAYIRPSEIISRSSKNSLGRCMGMWVAESLPTGTHLGVYGGMDEECFATYDNESRSYNRSEDEINADPYLLEVRKSGVYKLYNDARGFLRYINDRLGKGAENVRVSPSGVFSALRELKPYVSSGPTASASNYRRELSYSYGWEYWESREIIYARSQEAVDEEE